MTEDNSVLADRLAKATFGRAAIAPLSGQAPGLDVDTGYAIQGLAAKFIDRIEGCYFNVVGLPVALVYRHLKEISIYR